MSSLDALLLGATKGTIETTLREEELPQRLSRNQVRMTLRPIAKKVRQSCSKYVDKPVLVIASITVANTGKVTTVSVTGGPEQANKCVEDIVKTAKFPRFREKVFNVRYPFNLRPPEQ